MQLTPESSSYYVPRKEFAGWSGLSKASVSEHNHLGFVFSDRDEFLDDRLHQPAFTLELL